MNTTAGTVKLTTDDVTVTSHADDVSTMADHFTVDSSKDSHPVCLVT